MLSCGQRIGNAKLFIPNLEKKNFGKGIGGLLPTYSHSLGEFEGGCTLWGESSSLTVAGRAQCAPAGDEGLSQAHTPGYSSNPSTRATSSASTDLPGWISKDSQHEQPKLSQ